MTVLLVHLGSEWYYQWKQEKGPKIQLKINLPRKLNIGNNQRSMRNQGNLLRATENTKKENEDITAGFGDRILLRTFEKCLFVLRWAWKPHMKGYEVFAQLFDISVHLLLPALILDIVLSASSLPHLSSTPTSNSYTPSTDFTY